MADEMRKLTVMLPKHEYLKLRVQALMRKMSVGELLTEMIRYCRPPRHMNSGPEPIGQEGDDFFFNFMMAHLKNGPERVDQVIDDMKSDVLARIKDMNQNKGMSHAQIARRLNQENVPTPSGRGQWHRQTIQRLLKGAGNE